MQIKNIISFIFFSQFVISFPRRNRNGRGVEDVSVSTSTASSLTSSTASLTSSTASSTTSSMC